MSGRLILQGAGLALAEAGSRRGLGRDVREEHKSTNPPNPSFFFGKIGQKGRKGKWVGFLGDRFVDQNYQKRTQTIDRSKIA